MLPTNLDEVSEDYLAIMCREQRPESQRLDFKRTLPDIRAPQWREEFTKDICALANTEGGDIVFGIGERDACADTIDPIVGEAQDAAMRRLGQVADARIQPRIVGLQFRAVGVAGGYVLVLRVPQSYNGPHGYVANDALRFPVRVRTHTTDMSYEQLRTAFDRTATLRERARAFRQDRVQKIITRQTWRAMPAGPLFAMHFVPLQSAAGNDLVDVRSLYHNYMGFRFQNWGSTSRNLHLDGLSVYVVQRGEDEVTPAYTQIFRSGAIEAVRWVGRSPDQPSVINGPAVAFFIRDAVTMLLQAAKSLSLNGPATIGAALVDIGGYTFSHGMYENPSRADRPHLVLPELWIERAEAVENPETIWRPIADLLWQCFDLETCTAFQDARYPR
jgi:hypothetical protein